MLFHRVKIVFLNFFATTRSNQLYCYRQNRNMKEDLRKLEFKAQLAHDGSVTKKISDFSNVKELYLRLAEVFDINRNEVCN